MRTWLSASLLLLASRAVQGLEVLIDQTEENSQKCAGMYSRSTWGGAVDPFISIKFDKYEGPDDPIVSLVIFEWKDENFVGVYPDANSYNKIGACRQQQVDAGYCNTTNLGEFILAENTTTKSTNLVYTKAVHLKDTPPIKYMIKNTGYYCVVTEKYTTDQYRAILELRNAYGELPATQIPKLPFYGGISILYALVAVFWGFLYYQHRSDILPVQNYITAILIFLVVEMLMTWGFYDYLNQNGSNIGAKVLLVIVAILNAVRNSFSFFLLLIVCMGYGVVKPTLGRTMIYVRWLAVAHFVFGLVYAITSLVVSPDAAGPFVLLIVLPLAGTLTAFYVWTLNSLNLTLKDLIDRKQTAKALMYRKLWWCILTSIVVLFGFFFFNSFTFAASGDPDYVPFHWKTRWFVLDGWLNLVYFADVAFVAYVWRPTANNRRFAMSDELAQDDDGTFEINNMDIGNPDDSDDEEEIIGTGAPKKPTTQPQPQQSGVGPASMPAAAPSRSVPQQARAQPAQRPARDSFEESETIFAVGDDDRFSDDEGSGEEAGLVKAKK